MKQKQQAISLPALGGSSLLVIFGILCMTVLAMLSLDTALAQQRLSESATQAITAYYKADLEAETIFAQLRCGEIPAAVEQEDGLFWYTCPISSRQTLHVALRQGADGWEVLRWQAVAEDIAVDEELPVWKEER